MRIRRALLFMPGDDRRKIEKGAGLDVDSVIIDMEDGVALSNKQAAREVIPAALRELDFGRTERLVRLNAIGGALWADDLRATTKVLPDGYVLPKIEHAWQVQSVAEAIADAEAAQGKPEGSVRLLAMIETALGVVHLREIASSSPRLDALLFGAEDLAGDLGATRTAEGWEVFYARSTVLLHAKVFGLQAIDTIYADLTNIEGLLADTRFARQMGYTGKTAIHPRQVEPIQTVFTPTRDEIETARRLIEAFEEHQARGVGVFDYQGKMVDMPMLRAAETVIALARAAGMDV